MSTLAKRSFHYLAVLTDYFVKKSSRVQTKRWWLKFLFKYNQGLSGIAHIPIFIYTQFNNLSKKIFILLWSSMQNTNIIFVHWNCMVNANNNKKGSWHWKSSCERMFEVNKYDYQLKKYYLKVFLLELATNVAENDTLKVWI